ncbi:MAG: RDD family protein [Planctomycetota bacterium]
MPVSVDRGGLVGLALAVWCAVVAAPATAGEVPAGAGPQGYYLAISGPSEAGIVTTVLKSPLTGPTITGTGSAAENWRRRLGAIASDDVPGWRAIPRVALEGPARALAVGDGEVFVLMHSGQVWAIPADAALRVRPGMPQGQARALAPFPSALTALSWTASNGRPWALASGPAWLDPPVETERKLDLDARLLGLALDLPHEMLRDNEAAEEDQTRGVATGEVGAAAPDAEANEPAPDAASPEDPPATPETDAEPGPADGEAAREPESDRPPEQPPAESPAGSVRDPHLLTLSQGAWREVPLPDAVAGATRSVTGGELDDAAAAPGSPPALPKTLLIPAPAGVDRPGLVQQTTASRLTLWRPITQEPAAEGGPEPAPEDAGWTALPIVLDTPGRLLAATQVGDDTVVLVGSRPAQSATAQTPARLRLLAVRGDAVQPLAEIDPSPGEADPYDPATWRVALGPGKGVEAIVLAVSPSPRASGGDEDAEDASPRRRGPSASDAPPARGWAVSLETGAVSDALPIEPVPYRPLSDQFGFVLLLSVVGVALVLMLIYWQREPELRTFDAPPGRKLADLPRRAVAGTIDLLPGFAIAGWLFETTPGQVLAAWPGFSERTSLAELLPALAVIVGSVLVAGVVETATARSPGKWIVGLRVDDWQGQPPQRWRLALRNAMRAFDLVAPLLVLLAVITPTRQRLGDMLAGVVVTMADPDAANGPEARQDSRAGDGSGDA